METENERKLREVLAECERLEYKDKTCDLGDGIRFRRCGYMGLGRVNVWYSIVIFDTEYVISKENPQAVRFAHSILGLNAKPLIDFLKSISMSVDDLVSIENADNGYGDGCIKVINAGRLTSKARHVYNEWKEAHNG